MEGAAEKKVSFLVWAAMVNFSAVLWILVCLSVCLNLLTLLRIPCLPLHLVQGILVDYLSYLDTQPFWSIFLSQLVLFFCLSFVLFFLLHRSFHSVAKDQRFYLVRSRKRRQDKVLANEEVSRLFLYVYCFISFSCNDSGKTWLEIFFLNLSAALLFSLPLWSYFKFHKSSCMCGGHLWPTGVQLWVEDLNCRQDHWHWKLTAGKSFEISK